MVATEIAYQLVNVGLNDRARPLMGPATRELLKSQEELVARAIGRRNPILRFVEGLVRRMSDELGGGAVCIATGGLADVIAPEIPLIQHVDADLTLHGLRIVWERNQ